MSVTSVSNVASVPEEEKKLKVASVPKEEKKLKGIILLDKR